MICAILRDDDRRRLKRIARNTRLPVPFVDDAGRRVGNVLRVWVEGNALMADIEAVPGDDFAGGLYRADV